jgi:hypothetical protein
MSLSGISIEKHNLVDITDILEESRQSDFFE